MSHVLGRPPYKRYPIHLFIDECQYFVSPTMSEILGESRKFGLYITVATQRIERLNSDLQDAILGNVGNIWVGNSRHTTAEKLSRETDIDAEKIRKLQNLQFFQVATSEPTKRQHLRYIGNRYCMSPKLWQNILKQQSQKYYRKSSTPESPSSTPGASASWNPDFF